MKERENLPPLFWIAMLVLAFISPNAEAADTGFDLAVACVAINVFHEAANEPEMGKLAVAWVTVHRMQESNGDACDVVFKRKQFSWANNALDHRGKLKSEYMPHGWKWQESRRIARLVLNSEAHDFTNGATHYHAVYIKTPRWTKHMLYVGRWGAHLFYRNKDV